MATDRSLSIPRTARPPRRLVTTSRSHDLLVAICFLVPAFAFLAVFVYLPTILALVLAFLNYQGGNTPTPWVGLSNLHQAITYSVFQQSLENTLYYAAMVVPGTLILSIAIAMLIQRASRVYAVIRTLVLLPYVTPTIGTAIGWLWIYDPSFGIANAVLHFLHLPMSTWMQSPSMAMPAVAIYSLWHGVGFDVIIILTAITGLPQGVLEAAMVDGASSWRRFWKITLPLISPTVFFITVITAIGSFQAFSQVYALSTGTGGPEYATTTTLFLIYQTAFQYGNFSYAAAMAVYLVLLIFILTMVLRWVGRRAVFYD